MDSHHQRIFTGIQGKKLILMGKPDRQGGQKLRVMRRCAEVDIIEMKLQSESLGQDFFTVKPLVDPCFSEFPS